MKSRITQLGVPYVVFSISIIALNLLILDIFIIRYFFQIPTGVLGTTTATVRTQACPQACIDTFQTYASGYTSSAKEHYVTLGTGSGYAGDWSDVTGIEATIDTTQYRKIKTATFEATAGIPSGSGTVSLRLFNATDKHPVWYSDVSMSGSGPVALTSQPITLDAGKKLYKVQIKTQLQYPASVLQARIHVITY